MSTISNGSSLRHSNMTIEEGKTFVSPSVLKNQTNVFSANEVTDSPSPMPQTPGMRHSSEEPPSTDPQVARFIAEARRKYRNHLHASDPTPVTHIAPLEEADESIAARRGADLDVDLLANAEGGIKDICLESGAPPAHVANPAPDSDGVVRRDTLLSPASQNARLEIVEQEVERKKQTERRGSSTVDKGWGKPFKIQWLSVRSAPRLSVPPDLVCRRGTCLSSKRATSKTNSTKTGRSKSVEMVGSFSASSFSSLACRYGSRSDSGRRATGALHHARIECHQVGVGRRGQKTRRRIPSHTRNSWSGSGRHPSPFTSRFASVSNRCLSFYQAAGRGVVRSHGQYTRGLCDGHCVQWASRGIVAFFSPGVTNGKLNTRAFEIGLHLYGMGKVASRRSELAARTRAPRR
jgi:hypothetical protein